VRASSDSGPMRRIKDRAVWSRKGKGLMGRDKKPYEAAGSPPLIRERTFILVTDNEDRADEIYKGRHCGIRGPKSVMPSAG